MTCQTLISASSFSLLHNLSTMPWTRQEVCNYCWSYFDASQQPHITGQLLKLSGGQITPRCPARCWSPARWAAGEGSAVDVALTRSQIADVTKRGRGGQGRGGERRGIIWKVRLIQKGRSKNVHLKWTVRFETIFYQLYLQEEMNKKTDVLISAITSCVKKFIYCRWVSCVNRACKAVAPRFTQGDLQLVPHETELLGNGTIK